MLAATARQNGGTLHPQASGAAPLFQLRIIDISAERFELLVILRVPCWHEITFIPHCIGDPKEKAARKPAALQKERGHGFLPPVASESVGCVTRASQTH
jgi:hypothetical protein